MAIVNEQVWQRKRREARERREREVAEQESELKALVGMIHSRAEAERQLAAARERLLAMRDAVTEYEAATGHELRGFGALTSGVARLEGKIESLLALIASGEYLAVSR